MGKKSDTAEMLEVLATLDSVEAVIPTVIDHQAGITPEWCELRLTIKRETSDDIGGDFPVFIDVPLRRHDGELIIEVLHSVLHDWSSGQVDYIWEMMDKVVARIQKRSAKGKSVDPVDVGKAQGLAMAIAIMNNPFDPDLDGVRDTAMTRWELRQ